MKSVATGQGVPLARNVSGGKVRLFFEAQGADGKTRVMHLDSADGYFGQDFNAGSAATCTTAADYATGGGCAPTVDIAVDGDAGGNSEILNARQFKLGWPTLANGCPKMFTSAQVAFPLHSGGVRYRLYYGDPSVTEGRGSSTLTIC